MMWFDSTFQCPAEFFSFVAKTPLRKFSHLFRGGCTINDGFQNSSSRYTHHIRCYTGQLDIGTFQDFLHPIAQRSSFLHECAPKASQLPQLPLTHGWNETGGKQAMPKQIRNP